MSLVGIRPAARRCSTNCQNIVVAEGIRRVGRRAANDVGDNRDAAQRAVPHRVLAQRVHVIRRQDGDDRVRARPHGGVWRRPRQPRRTPEDQMHPHRCEQPATPVTKPAGGPSLPCCRLRLRPRRIDDPGLLVTLRSRLLAHDTPALAFPTETWAAPATSQRPEPRDPYLVPSLHPQRQRGPGLIHRAGTAAPANHHASRHTVIAGVPHPDSAALVMSTRIHVPCLISRFDCQLQRKRQISEYARRSKRSARSRT